MSTDNIHLLGFAGSLRKDSYNRSALRAANELLPEGVSLETFDLSPIPLYNGDVEGAGIPEPVKEFKERIAAADALLIVTPEYNYSMPGVLKNAIDWASRPLGQNSLNGKPLGMMGASSGLNGTLRAQLHLRQVAIFTNMYPINKPEVFIRQAANKFDEQGRLTDDDLRGQIRALLEALAEWTRRLKRGVEQGLKE